MTQHNIDARVWGILLQTRNIGFGENEEWVYNIYLHVALVNNKD